MADPTPPRRTPGGFVPPRVAKPEPPHTNGHRLDRPLNLNRSAWEEVDQEDEQRVAAEQDRVRFQRVADMDDSARVRAAGTPSRAVLVGVLIVVAAVVLAVVLYRMAPP